MASFWNNAEIKHNPFLPFLDARTVYKIIRATAAPTVTKSTTILCNCKNRTCVNRRFNARVTVLRGCARWRISSFRAGKRTASYGFARGVIFFSPIFKPNSKNFQSTNRWQFAKGERRNIRSVSLELDFRVCWGESGRGRDRKSTGNSVHVMYRSIEHSRCALNISFSRCSFPVCLWYPAILNNKPIQVE